MSTNDFVSEPGESVRTYLLFIAEQSLEPALRHKIGASDLVQQTLLNAHQARHRFSGSTHEEYKGWLRRILLRVVLNFRRSVRDTEARRLDREVPLLNAANLPSGDDSPSTFVSRQEQQSHLNWAVAQLPVEYQRVLALHFDHDLPHAEIGRQMGGRSEGAARMLLARALEKLREVLVPSVC